MRLEEGAFVGELMRIIERSKEVESQGGKGSVFITLKRDEGKRARLAQKGKIVKGEEESPLPACLIRVKCGRKKISTSVAAKEALQFSGTFANVLKAEFDGLKKKEKKKANLTGSGSKKRPS